jgi:nitroreductase
MAIMDTIDSIKSRRSVRRFHPDQLPEDILYVILEAANMAPCAGGLQTWRFLIVENDDDKKVIAKSALNQDWIATAPTIVIMCSEPKRLEAEFGTRAKELYDIQNTSMAAQNLMLAAWNFGIGSTFIAAFTEPLLRKQFKIPTATHIHGIIPLGYPDEAPPGILRIEIPDITHFEKWGEKVRKGLEMQAGTSYFEKHEFRIGEALEAKAKKGIEKVKKHIKKKGKKK